MVRLVEYRIISGPVIEIRRCRMAVGAQPGRRRAPRKAGASSLKKIMQNEKAAVQRLARIINANFGAGDLWLTLKYSDARLPVTKEEAKKEVSKFIRNLGRTYKKATGRKLRYICCTSDTSSKTGDRVRLHHHLVMDRAAYELLCRYWPQEEISYTILDGRKDHTDLARYIVKNASKTADEKKWSCSRGLDKPIYTEPIPVSDCEIKTPKGAEVREKNVYIDEDYGASSAYLRAVMPERPKVRGGRVVLNPKKKSVEKEGVQNERKHTRQKE